MTRATFLFSIAAAGLITASCAVTAEQTIPDKELGLVKGSVFDTPAPPAYEYTKDMPGSTKPLPRSYYTAPPQIPHNIDAFVPITAKNNACRGCHDNPAQWGKPRQKGMPPPIPESHYVDPAYGHPEAGLKGKKQKTLSNARYNCVQCHAPQANAAPLVQNTFKPAK